MKFFDSRKRKESLYTIIFEADTPAGRYFDIVVIWAILLSLVIVILESVHTANQAYRVYFAFGEWFFTLLFTVEYLLRLYVVRRKLSYALSFFGIIDLLSILPTFISLIFPGTQYLMDIRILRLMRIFRIFKLTRFISEAATLKKALLASRHKITVFFSTLALIVVVIGSVMYVVEGPSNGFINIPTGIYWAVVTLTTVGYGDISPQTGLGQFLASLVMVIGYSIIAVPTGIFVSEFSKTAAVKKVTTQVCPHCLAEGHDDDATHCKYCGAVLNP